MTLFFSSRSSSSFVALNATAGCSVFVRIQNDAFADLRLPSLDEGINWFSLVSKRWHSSFQVDHHHLSSRWMRPQLLSFCPHQKWCVCLFAVAFPGWRDKLISFSQQKMTLFFSSRSSSSFVALNATAGCSVFVRIQNDAFADLRLPSLDEGINWFSLVSKRWHSSFQVDHHHLSSRWMRPQVAQFLSAWKMMCLLIFGCFFRRFGCGVYAHLEWSLHQSFWWARAGREVPLTGVVWG